MTDAENMRRLLAETLEKLGVSVQRVRRGDDEGAGGGLCLIRGRHVVFLDAGNTVSRDLELLTDALSRVHDGASFLPPAVREWLDRHPPTV